MPVLAAKYNKWGMLKWWRENYCLCNHSVRVHEQGPCGGKNDGPCICQNFTPIGSALQEIRRAIGA